MIGFQLDNEFVFTVNPDVTDSIINTRISTLYLYKFTFIELQESNRKYLVLFYRYPSHFNIQMIEMEINHEHIVGETLTSTQHEQEFIKEKMRELRQILESRGAIVREINEISSLVIRKDKEAKIKSMKVTEPVLIENGMIDSLSVHSDLPLKSTPETLLNEIGLISARTSDLMHHIRPTEYERYKREFTPNFKTKKIIAKNLHYEGPEFENLILKSQPNTLRSVVNVKSLEIMGNLNVTQNVVNKIDLNDVVTHDFIDRINGVKTFETINVETLHAPVINDVKVVSDVPKSRVSFRAVDGEDGFMSLPHDISIENLQVNRVNSLPWVELEKSSEVKSSNEIKGNLYMKRPSLVRNLNVDAVNSISVSDLMTKASDQDVNSVVWINRFFAPSISTRTVNGVNFKETVALQGQENHIRCKYFLQKFLYDF